MTFAFLIDSVPFTHAVIKGQTSLGGSESACLGLARALGARGHTIHIFTTQLDAEMNGYRDTSGLVWHDLRDFQTMNQFIEWDVVVSLRMFAAFGWRPVYARLRVLWNQDLLVPGPMQHGAMAVAWALDQIAYVSGYHRKQWEALQPDLTPLGWVTRNGYDPSHLPTEAVTKDPTRIIHISRPERGLGPLLDMWPAVKAERPHATFAICRYSSMYDQGKGSWSDVCASFDERVKAMQATVGGITYLGELTKPQLYQAVAESAVMWYPGVSTFAETSCIAAIEAQACGTPFVGSYRGALPETVPSGILIKGDHRSPEYQAASVAAVVDLLDQCQAQSFNYRRLQKAGLAHVKNYTYDVLAAEWEAQIERTFQARYDSNKVGVLRQLLHEDDHVAAKVVADEIVSTPIMVTDTTREEWCAPALAAHDEAATASAFCEYVIAGKDQSAEQYGNAAIADPLKEAEFSERFQAVIPHFAKSTHVLDVACGNGSFAIALARLHQTVRVFGLDYSAANIERAREGAERAGVADRCTFTQCTVYDFDRQDLHAEWTAFADGHAALGWRFDGLFVGEFIEHVGNYQAVIDGLEAVLVDGASVVYTCPHGACAELVPRTMPLRRGHVHRFHFDDVNHVWGVKQDFGADYLDSGTTERGNPLGNWLIHYTTAPNRPCGTRQLAERIQRTRPLQRVTVGIIAKDAENDLARCLSSIYPLADEILIADTGSRDTTKAIAGAYGPKVRVFDLPPVMDCPEGFAGTRNAVLDQATGEWFLWIDTDEQLINGPWLRRYIDGIVFNGFVIRQTHLYLDAPPTQDIPVRLFRHTGKVNFYGCIHEQPQDGDPNADIYPTLDVGDLRLAHTGYLTEEGREDKRVNRNLPLLIRDATVFKDRLLGKVLQIRESVIQADALRASVGHMTLRSQQGYGYAIKMFIECFDDPTHKYHKLARPWYEAALQHLDIGWEQEIALAGKFGGMGSSRAKPERVWVRDAPEFQRLVAFKTYDVAKGMQPSTFVTDPDDFATPAVQAMEVTA